MIKFYKCDHCRAVLVTKEILWDHVKVCHTNLKECITHHHACYCREAYLAKLEAVADAARGFFDKESGWDTTRAHLKDLFSALHALDSHDSEDAK